MSEDRQQVEAAMRYLSSERTVKIDKKSCRFWNSLFQGM